MSKAKSFWVRTGAAISATFLAGSATLSALPASAGALTEGTVLPIHAVVSVGPHSSIMVNRGPITGNVLLGDGNTSSSSAGGNGQVTGQVHVSPPASGDFLANIQIAPTIITVPSSVGMQAFSDADALSSAASALAPTQNFPTIGGGQTITGNGATNVIDVANINGAFSVSGTANDVFVFNVSGAFNSNQAMTLTGGVTASHILFNLTGKSGDIFQTFGGDVLFGTFLATDGGDFRFSNLDLTEQLINTDAHDQFVSGSKISAAPFTVPAPLIGHGLLVLLSVGSVLFGGGLLERWKNRRSLGMPAAA